MKVFFYNKSVIYKSIITLTILISLFFGQAIINTFGEYISNDFIKIIVYSTAPVLNTTNEFESISLALGLNPKNIIENEKVLADESVQEDVGNIKEMSVAAIAKADYNSAKGIEVKNNTDYSIDIETLINEDLSFKISNNKPSVLIVHTHTSESYLKSEGEDYEQSDNKRTQNQNYNVVKVGEVFKNALESKGIVAIHNKTVHDYPSYNGSYLNTLKTIEKEIKNNPSIKIVIDIHRDALEADGNIYKYSSKINGKDTACVMIVSGSDANGIENPLWQENFKFALKYQRRMNLLYPGLTRPLSLVRERYNTHITTGSIILEIGSTGNTLQEALNAAKFSGEALGDMLSYVLE